GESVGTVGPVPVAMVGAGHEGDAASGRSGRADDGPARPGVTVRVEVPGGRDDDDGRVRRVALDVPERDVPAQVERSDGLGGLVPAEADADRRDSRPRHRLEGRQGEVPVLVPGHRERVGGILDRSGDRRCGDHRHVPGDVDVVGRGDDDAVHPGGGDAAASVSSVTTGGASTLKMTWISVPSSSVMSGTTSRVGSPSRGNRAASSKDDGRIPTITVRPWYAERSRSGVTGMENPAKE